MLAHLQIRDFAIIDSVELELAGGLTALTGETGAGKSIVVDAVMLALGGRASADALRHGAERAEITATFEIGADAATRLWLEEQSIAADDGELVLRRVIGRDGRSRQYVNGQASPAQSVRDADWSPEATAGRLHIDYPQDKLMRISTETIYRWIYRDASKGGVFYTCLRWQHRKCRAQRALWHRPWPHSRPYWHCPAAGYCGAARAVWGLGRRYRGGRQRARPHSIACRTQEPLLGCRKARQQVG